MNIAAPVRARTERVLQSRMMPAKIVDYIYRRMAAMPHEYPPIVVIVSDVAMIVVTIVAVGQRGWPPPVVTLVGGVVALAPLVAMLARKNFVPTKARMLVTLTAAAILGASLIMVEPAQADVTPFILVLIAGEVSAMARPRVSLAVGAVAILAVVIPASLGRLEYAPVYIMMVATGWFVGFILQTQLRLLEQERATQKARAEQAASDERQRIAREVHDVVAHSLSVTLLHLTGARRALQEDGDIEEAIDALKDAEQLGRQSMSDIRRTVGLLDNAPSKHTPEPGVADIDALVSDFVRAGMPVAYFVRGDATAVSAATGLCLYRIMQESLANVAKHAPGAKVHAALRITSVIATMTVTNDLPRRATHKELRGGSGIRGMQHRAEALGGQLTAEPTKHGWCVTAEIPFAPHDPDYANCWLFGGQE
ncbi:sensor histidine kinase [Aldersonia kunmingensis]|uniref:sensor histidine kinase n=1 Tax=Aldersonia kunmingensis TaxID=408066 RepID=UPI000AAC99F6|nr:histidine kinase [Aldersonia kunmingensis]